MSTTGRRDDAGDPGNPGTWKGGFNLGCGVPGPLLVLNAASGPWRVQENPRATKNRYYIVQIPTSERSWTIGDVVDLRFRTAFIGPDHETAVRLCERLNGWELAKDFPPQERREV